MKPCCEWKGTINTKGYGVVTIDGKQFKAHRLAVILSGRKYPKGMVSDHICRNRACINPDHIEIVTSGENVLRGESFSAKNRNKIACSRGHLYSEHGFFQPRRGGKIWRICKICRLDKERLREAKKKLK